MIVPRACDFCLSALPTELVQFELVHGSLASGPNFEWTIEPVTAGTRLTTICRSCSEYLQGSIDHLRRHYVEEQQQRESSQTHAS